MVLIPPVRNDRWYFYTHFQERKGERYEKQLKR